MCVDGSGDLSRGARFARNGLAPPGVVVLNRGTPARQETLMPNTSHQPFTDRQRQFGQRQVVRTPDEARAGIVGQHVRAVLTWSTVGAIVLFILLFWYYFA